MGGGLCCKAVRLCNCGLYMEMLTLDPATLISESHHHELLNDDKLAACPSVEAPIG